MRDVLDPATQYKIRTTAERLHDEFRGVFSAETIERYIAESTDDLSGADEGAQDLAAIGRARVHPPQPAAQQEQTGRRIALAKQALALLERPGLEPAPGATSSGHELLEATGCLRLRVLAGHMSWP